MSIADLAYEIMEEEARDSAGQGSMKHTDAPLGEHADLPPGWYAPSHDTYEHCQDTLPWCICSRSKDSSGPCHLICVMEKHADLAGIKREHFHLQPKLRQA